jgi:HSP20 family molecular chaperone IbpA
MTETVTVTQSQGTGKTHDAATEDVLWPPVDVLENAQGITLYADLPGVTREGLNVQVEGETLVIEGAITLPAPESLDAIHTEVGLSRYRRVFTLSKELDPDKVSAVFAQGVLTLTVPKAAHAQPRKIAIQVD